MSGCDPDIRQRVLNKQQPALVIHRLASFVAAIPDCSVERHDGGDDAVGFLGGFGFVGSDVACRVLPDGDVVCHPREHRMPAVSEPAVEGIVLFSLYNSSKLRLAFVILIRRRYASVGSPSTLFPISMKNAGNGYRHLSVSLYRHMTVW